MIFLQASNRLTGAIPEVSQTSAVMFVELSHNHLNATIPETWLDSANLQYFAAGFNRLSGEIPGPGLESEGLLTSWASQSMFSIPFSD